MSESFLTHLIWKGTNRVNLISFHWCDLHTIQDRELHFQSKQNEHDYKMRTFRVWAFYQSKITHYILETVSICTSHWDINTQTVSLVFICTPPSSAVIESRPHAVYLYFPYTSFRPVCFLVSYRGHQNGNEKQLWKKIETVQNIFCFDRLFDEMILKKFCIFNSCLLSVS